MGTIFTEESYNNCAGCSNVGIQETLECLHKNCREFDENALDSNRKTLNKSVIIIECFSMFAKRIENFIDVAEASGDLHTDPQITNKVFSVILKAHIFHYIVQG